MSDPKHIKIKTSTIKEDGTIEYELDSYYEKLSHRRVEYEKPYMVDRSNILSVHISCLDPLMLDGSDEVNITIKKKKDGKFLLTKRWVSENKSYGKQ